MTGCYASVMPMSLPAAERSEEEPEGNEAIITRTHAQTCCIGTVGVVKATCMSCVLPIYFLINKSHHQEDLKHCFEYYGLVGLSQFLNISDNRIGLMHNWLIK